MLDSSAIPKITVSTKITGSCQERGTTFRINQLHWSVMLRYCGIRTEFCHVLSGSWMTFARLMPTAQRAVPAFGALGVSDTMCCST